MKSTPRSAALLAVLGLALAPCRAAEVHVYDTGGHGYGLRYVAEQPVTTWPQRAEAWPARRGLLQPAAGAAR